jgi:hypothetical protein
VSEIQVAFRGLVEALSGHFDESRQKKIRKAALLELLFLKMSDQHENINALISDYANAHNAQINNNFKRAFIKAIKDISIWIEKFYLDFTGHAIQFSIDENCKLKAIVQDGFDNRSLISLVQEISTLLTEIDELRKKAQKLFDGKVQNQHANEFSDCIGTLTEKTNRLLKVQNALRRRT